LIFTQKDIQKVTDEKLMLRIRNGDKMAFNELYARYHQRLFYYFFRMLGSDRELANDLLQDIFVKIIHKPELFNADYRFSSWIFSVANNMCKNEYRRKEVRKIISSDADIAEISAGQDSESDEDKKDLITQIFAELEQLDKNQKSILILRYKENFSINEISEILKLPKGTVKSRLHYARLELSKKMTEKGIVINGNHE